MTARLWGWLSPDQPDPLATAPKARELIARTLGLIDLIATPPRPLDPASVPASRLTKPMRAALAQTLDAASVSFDPIARTAATLGQSYPDQLTRRAGSAPFAADAVARPRSAAEAQALLTTAQETGFRVMPSGGGTNVVGAFADDGDSRPLVACSLGALTAVREINPRDRTAIAEAGILLPDLEARLGADGLTLGHFPQSYEGARLGGSIAANGAGQRSDGYGRLAENLLSAHLATPSGPWSTESFRHAATGPWLGGLVAGSEGLFGIVTEATLRLATKPSVIADEAWFVADFEAGIEAARAMAQCGAGASMVRVSDAAETAFLGALRHALAGRDGPPLIERLLLSARRAPADPCLVIVGAEGDALQTGMVFAAARRKLKAAGGVALGRRPGESWRRGRFHMPYLRESLLARGLGVDTVETMAPWSKAIALRRGVVAALERAAAATGVRAAAFCHLSHSHAEGACLYFTVVFPRAGDERAQWRTLKTAATEAILAHGGALSHHHGIGADHASWAPIDKGAQGIAILAGIRRALDPDRVMATGMARMLDGETA